MEDYKKSRGIAIGCALIFGCVGLHKFYLEKPRTGLLYLLFSWTLIPAVVSFITGLRWTLMDSERWHEIYESSYNLRG